MQETGVARLANERGRKQETAVEGQQKSVESSEKTVRMEGAHIDSRYLDALMLQERKGGASPDLQGSGNVAQQEQSETEPHLYYRRILDIGATPLLKCPSNTCSMRFALKLLYS